MDIRHPLTDLDMTMLEGCWQNNLAVHILLTKSDKYKFGKAKNTLLTVQSQLNDQPRTSIQLFSALKKQGVTEARAKLATFYNATD